MCQNDWVIYMNGLMGRWGAGGTQWNVQKSTSTISLSARMSSKLFSVPTSTPSSVSGFLRDGKKRGLFSAMGRTGGGALDTSQIKPATRGGKEDTRSKKMAISYADSAHPRVWAISIRKVSEFISLSQRPCEGKCQHHKCLKHVLWLERLFESQLSLTSGLVRLRIKMFTELNVTGVRAPCPSAGGATARGDR